MLILTALMENQFLGGVESSRAILDFNILNHNSV